MKDNSKNKDQKYLTRKEFLRATGRIVVGASVAPLILGAACSGGKAEAGQSSSAAMSPSNPKVFVVKGGTPRNLTYLAIQAAGGMRKYVPDGAKVALVPNIAWARTPEMAANTHPEVVRAIIEMCFEAGAKQVEVVCNPCNTPKVTYQMSGIEEAAKDAGAYIVYLTDADFQEVAIPDGVWQKKNRVAKQVLDADVFISAPIAKHHGLSQLTLIQKNLLGVVYNRSELHQNIHREIVALQKVLPADLYILDCTRILLRGGPQGGNLADVKNTEQVVVGTDPVAIESYAATLFGKEPSSIGFIKNASDAGLGTMNWQSVTQIIG